MVVKWFLGLYKDRLMKWVVAYTMRPKFFTIRGNYNFVNGNFLGLRLFNLNRWRTFAMSLTIFGGAGFGFFSIFLFPIDVVFLFDGMMRTSFGVGSSIAKEHGYDASVIQHEDFLNVIAIWCGIPEFVEDESAQHEVMNSFLETRITAKVGAKAAIKLSWKMAMKFGGKAIAKLAATLLGVVPVLSSLVNAYINYYFIDQIYAASVKYYSKKFAAQKLEDSYLTEVS